jgi:hypothetical protein
MYEGVASLEEQHNPYCIRSFRGGMKSDAQSGVKAYAIKNGCGLDKNAKGGESFSCSL